MYDYDKEINTEAKRTKKRWNGKQITTSKQWLYNDDGSACAMCSTLDDIYANARATLAEDYYYNAEY